MNFGTILNSVTKTCVTMMVESKDTESRSLARDFVRYVEIKEVLKKQFRVYHQLNSSFIKDGDSAKLFVNETLSMLDNYPFDDILGYNHILESRFGVSKMESTDINLAISKLIKYRTSDDKFGQEEYIDCLEKIVEHVSTVREEKDMLSELNDAMANTSIKFLQPKHIVRIALKKFNDRYTSKFDSEDRVIFGTLREGNEVDILKLYDNKIEQLIELANDGTKWMGKELSQKVFEAAARVNSGYTQENLLDAHELVSELAKLRDDFIDSRKES